MHATDQTPIHHRNCSLCPITQYREYLNPFDWNECKLASLHVQHQPPTGSEVRCCQCIHACNSGIYLLQKLIGHQRQQRLDCVVYVILKRRQSTTKRLAHVSIGLETSTSVFKQVRVELNPTGLEDEDNARPPE